MANTFDFNKVKLKTMNVTLSDEKKTTLIITTPDKKLMEELKSFKNLTQNLDETDVLDSLYELAAKIMSRNKNGVKVSAEMLKELYDNIGYIIAFLNAYTDFVKDLIGSKN
jgi:hypothetical protein